VLNQQQHTSLKIPRVSISQGGTRHGVFAAQEESLSGHPRGDGVCTAWSHAVAADPYTYSVIQVTNTAPGLLPIVTFSVKTAADVSTDLATDPAWTQTVSGNSRLFLQIAWNTRDFNNTNSLSNTVSGGRGAAMPIPVNLLSTPLTRNIDGTYSVTSVLPVPLSATGTGRVAMEGHPAGQDATGAWTVRVPVKSVYKDFTITDATVQARRQIVDVNKCMTCHKTNGTGAAPRLTLHGNNRTEEPQVCVVCHNPNNTDIPFRGIITSPLTNTNPTVVVGSNTYPEQSIDFKRLVHGIHASSAGFRNNPLVVVSFNGTIFDASKLIKFPSSLRNCNNCHIDNGTKGTFELQASGPPLGPNVLGSTMNTQSESNSRLANGTFVINTNPADNVRISPTAAACSSCHDGREVTSHMVSTGGASFKTTQQAIDSGVVRERCNSCHGPGKEESVRRVHIGSSSDDD
jgi:OmcA/MtrC family decaheme c-type cytochrome